MATDSTQLHETGAPRSPRRRTLAWFVAIGSVIVLVAVAVTTVLLARSGTTHAASSPVRVTGAEVDPGSSMHNKPAPNFRLTNQFGQQVSLSQFRGKAVLIAFVDSECTTICPLTTTAMLEAQQMMGPAGSKVALLGIDANPDATTVSDVRGYSSAHALTNKWQFLTGSKAALAKVWKDYSVYVAVTTTGIDHEPVIYLADPSGHLQRVYVTQMAYGAVHPQAAVIAGELSAVLPGHPAPDLKTAVEANPVPPTRAVSLPSATGGAPVTLGDTAHLVVFFDTWLTETTDLAARLEALNAYVQKAAQNHWPSLVAVDVAPVEASPGALAHFLSGLPHPLAYPVVVDQTGAVADGYGAQDAPWFTLTSNSGKVLFTNDGWFPLPNLYAAMAKATKAGAGPAGG